MWDNDIELVLNGLISDSYYVTFINTASAVTMPWHHIIDRRS